MLLSSAYCPPVEYFALMARDMTLSEDRVFPSKVHIEAKESFLKQTYRTRCMILGPRGTEMLQVPVVHSDNMRMDLVEVDHSTPWVTRTERALDTAYFSSAYFDYYRDGLFELLESGEKSLLKYNTAITLYLAECAGIRTRLSFTEDFTAPGTEEDDWRYLIAPKKNNGILAGMGLQKPYFQVFSPKFGFTPGLSMMDLLFNEGPESIKFVFSE